ncbi:MAG: recombinase family protein, partial [Ilumatobacteraceae bacterium]
MRAAVYCRISRDPQGTELGVRRQQNDATALCEREGWEIADTFVDDDRSAYSGKLRPGLIALRDLVKSGDVDVVVAWHPDRLTRHPRELEDLIDLSEATHTTVRTCQT